MKDYLIAIITSVWCCSKTEDAVRRKSFAISKGKQNIDKYLSWMKKSLHKCIFEYVNELIGQSIF